MVLCEMQVDLLSAADCIFNPSGSKSLLAKKLLTLKSGKHKSFGEFVKLSAAASDG